MAACHRLASVPGMVQDDFDTAVLIAGAGPVGLTVALSLARFGVRSLIVERHHAISPHPRARFVNARTMELFRRLGIEGGVRAAAIPDDVASDVVWAPTLAAPEVRRVEIETLGPKSGEPVSPAPGVCTSQDVLDPLLYGAALETGLVEVRFSVRLIDLEQDAHGVTARCEDPQGRSSKIRARYAVGADGSNSTVRERCGIVMQGPAALGHSVNIHFRADLSAALRGRSINLAMILNPAQPGLLLNIDGAHRWTAQAIVSPAKGESPTAFDDERCRAVVRAQVGDPELPVEIVGVAPWTSAARVAEHLSAGRVHLAGDAAQEMPPAGGFGMNVGIQEAENLAWKLASVLSGWAGPALLATYEIERLPIAHHITEQAFLNLKSVGRVESADGSPPQIRLGRPELFREHGLVFGATYASSAVVPDESQRPHVENSVSEYRPSASPGCRAPHVWIEVAGERRSTVDLTATGFVLLQIGGDPPSIGWPDGVPGRAICTQDPALAQAFELESGGMVLIRPDGHVAWRSRAAPRTGEADAIIGSILDVARTSQKA